MKKLVFLFILVFSIQLNATVVVSTISELQSAIQNANNGGDNDIQIADGTYNLNGAYFVVSGDDISIKSQSGDRDAVVFDGEYVTTEIFQITGSNITLADLTVKRAQDHPIHVMGGENANVVGVVISNIHLIDPGQQGIKINTRFGHTVDYGIINNCKIELTNSGRDYVWNHNGSCYTGGIDAHKATGWEIRDNEIIGFWCSNGLSEHGIHFWNFSVNTLVERNLIIDCDRGIGFGLGSSGHHGGIIRNNMIYNPTNHGYTDVGIGLETADNVEVYNNTIFFYHNYPNAIEYRFVETTGGIIKNNLTNKSITSRNGATADVSNNITTALSGWFLNVGSGDLHLASEVSSVVDQGVSIAGLVDDFDQISRPIGDGIDIGADEYGTSLSLCDIDAGEDRAICQDEFQNGAILGGEILSGDIVNLKWEAFHTDTILGNINNYYASDMLDDTTVIDPIVEHYFDNSVTYYLTGVTSDNQSCTDSVTLHFSNWTFILGKKIAYKSPNDTIQLSIGAMSNWPHIKYEWSPNYMISDTTVEAPLVWNDTTVYYSLIITNSLNCSVEDSDYEVHIIPSSTNNIDNKHKMNVYPNPAKDMISIECDGDVSKFILFTIDGKKIIDAVSHDIDISSIKSGIYILQANYKDGTRSHEMIDIE